MRSFQPLLLVDVLETTTPGVSALESQETGTLESGTFAYVRSVKTLFVLDKSSTVDPDGGIVAAMNGGNWIPQSSVGASYSAAGVRQSDGSTKAITLIGTTTWVTMPGGANLFTAEYTGGNWGFSSTTGKLTWNGPDDQPLLVTAAVSGYENTTVADVSMAIGKNEAPSDFQTQVSAPVATGASSIFAMSLSGILTVDQGDAIDLLFAGESSVLTLTRLSLTVAPLS